MIFGILSGEAFETPFSVLFRLPGEKKSNNFKG